MATTQVSRAGTGTGTDTQPSAIPTIDELQAWYLARTEAEGWVYTSVLRQLMNRMYRDRDYLTRRSWQGKRTAYDYAVERDQKALAWAVRTLVRHTPPAEKAAPEPPKAPRRSSKRLTAAERERTRGRPSWNGQPKRDWDGPELPPRNTSRGAHRD